MRTTVTSLVALAVWTMLLGIAATGSANADLYWVNGGDDTIGHSDDAGGSANQALVTAPDELGGGVAVDATHLYWSMASGGIMRSARDGSGAVSLIAGAANPYGIAVDGSYVYWASAGSDRIGRGPIAGGAADNDFIVTGPAPESVVVTDSHVYWGNSSDGTIGRALLDGSGVDNAFVTGLNSPRGLAVDGTWVYWIDSSTQRVGRTRLDGGGVPDPDYYELPYPAHSAAVVSSHLYWTETADGDIGWIDQRTGTGAYAIFDANGPLGIAATGSDFQVTPEVGTFADVTVGETGPGQTFTVTNGAVGSGAEPLELPAGGVTLTGPDAAAYAIDADTCSGASLLPGQTCAVTVSLRPATTGEKIAVLHFDTNTIAVEHRVVLTGTGVAPASGETVLLAMTPTRWDFGDVPLASTSPPAEFLVVNQGTTTVAIPDGATSIRDGAGLRILTDRCSGATLVRLATCTITVGFAPTAPGPVSGTLWLVSPGAVRATLTAAGVAARAPDHAGPADVAGRPSSTLRVRRARRTARVDRRGRAEVWLRCLGESGQRCTGTTQLLAPRRSKRLGVRGGERFAFDVGSREEIAIPLRRRVAKRLSAVRSCVTRRARVRLVLRMPAGERDVRRQRVRLRSPGCRTR